MVKGMKNTKLIVIFFIVIGISVLPYADAVIISKEVGPKNSFLYESSGGRWPTLQNNNQRTGFTEGSAPSEGNLLWKNDDCTAYKVSPVIADGKLYIYDLGRFYIYNAFTGEEIYMFEFPTYDDYWGDTGHYFSPVIYDDKLYVCGEYKVEDFDWDGVIFCYDLNEYYEIWKIRTPDLIEGCLSIYDDRIFFVADQVYCLDAFGGYEIWTYEVDEWAISQAISDDLLVFGLQDSSKLVCLDVDTGEEIWTYDTNQNGEFMTTPTIYEDMVYFSQGETFYCIDLYNGFEYWHVVTETSKMTPAAAGYEKVFVGSYDGVFYCFDAYSGSREWAYQTPWGWDKYEPIEGSPAIAENKVYFGGKGSNHNWYPQGYVYCLDAEYGNELWKYQTASVTDTSHIEGSPAIAYGIVYVSTFSGIYALGKEISGPRPPEIHGETYGENGNIYDYTFLSVDPSGNDLYYYVEWGDGDSTGWMGPYLNDEPFVTYHEWDEEGSYTIRAKAKNSDDEVSDWATMEVSMPRNKPYTGFFNQLLNNIMKFFQNIKLTSLR
jgi:outer membrane protein assembly factor BamB